MKVKDLPVPAPLRRALAAARKHVMSEEEMREQRISFAFGNLMECSPLTTKDDVRRAVAQPGVARPS